nr:ATP-binding cassette domain-containing protein [Rhizobiaceae bacterium]
MLNSIRARISRAFTELAIFSFVSNLLMLVMPLYMLQIYDRVLTSASIDTLIYISMIAGAALLLLGVVEVVRSIYAARVAARLDLDIGPNALIASMESPRAALGDIQPVRDLTAVRSFINSKSLFALFDLPFAPLFIGLTWFIHPTLFWMSAIGAVVLCFIAIANQWATAKAGKEAGEHGMAAMISAQSFVRSAETLRAMGMVENAIRAWGKNEAPHLQLQDGVAKINSFFAGISKTLRMALQVGILGVGGYLVLIGEMTPGMIFAASLISGRGLQPIDQIIGGWKQFVETWRAWKRLDKATVQLQARKEMDRTELPEPKGQLEAENIVYFTPNSAPGADPLLKRISFRLEPGEALAIIGPSGAGKSTLARVLVGAVQARTGVVRLDGADTRNWEPEKLGRHIGYLAQEADILPGTIAQNIARFDPDANSEDVV